MLLINPIIKIILALSLVLSATPFNYEPPKATVMVVGDIMMHTPLIYSGYDEDIKKYLYDSFFSEVEPIFSQADFVIGNLETPLAGPKTGFSGYPRFNSPKEIALALKQVGVNVLTTANNHSMDKWETGLIQTLNHLDDYEILHTGTYRSIEEKEQPLILEANDMKIGLIANTYGTNGLSVPKDKPYLVNMLDLETIREDVERLKAKNVDYIMAMIHFGTEYQRFPNEVQKKWVDDLFNIGVDFVLGSHPHVVQPLEIFRGDDSQSDKGVIYSLGNFLSNQRWDWKDYGIILKLSLEKDIKTKKVRIKEVSVVPTYVNISWVNGKREYKVIPLKNEKVDIDSKIWSNGRELVKHVVNTN